MITPAQCREMAEICDLTAAEQRDAARRREWLRMGSEWRVRAGELDLRLMRGPGGVNRPGR